jgi:ABC-type multidrug transport system ATPase subunit
MSGRVLLAVDQFSLDAEGAPGSLEVSSGEAWAVMGRSGAGKSDFLAAVAGLVQPGQGRLVASCEVDAAGLEPLKKRATARGQINPLDPTRSAEVVDALGLDEVRDEPVFKLPAGLKAAVGLVQALSGKRELVVIDHLVDLLDPWRQKAAITVIREQARTGRSFLVATESPLVAEQLGRVVLMSSGSPTKADTVEALRREAGQTEIVVEAADSESIRSLCEPFALSIRHEEGAVIIRAVEGQEAAVELLLKGYGHVKSVTIKEKSLTDILSVY